MKEHSPNTGSSPVRGGGSAATEASTRGSSLVEVLFATVLAVLFVGALLTVAIQQGAHRRVNLETSLAMTAAVDTLERVRTVPFATLPTLHGSGFDVPGVNGGAGGLRALSGDPDGLPGELAVSVDQTSAFGTLYRVVASVVWRGANRSRRLQIETLIAERK